MVNQSMKTVSLSNQTPRLKRSKKENCTLCQLGSVIEKLVAGKKKCFGQEITAADQNERTRGAEDVSDEFTRCKAGRHPDLDGLPWETLNEERLPNYGVENKKKLKLHEVVSSRRTEWFPPGNECQLCTVAKDLEVIYDTYFSGEIEKPDTLKEIRMLSNFTVKTTEGTRSDNYGSNADQFERRVYPDSENQEGDTTRKSLKSIFVTDIHDRGSNNLEENIQGAPIQEEFRSTPETQQEGGRSAYMLTTKEINLEYPAENKHYTQIGALSKNISLSSGIDKSFQTESTYEELSSGSSEYDGLCKTGYEKNYNESEHVTIPATRDDISSVSDSGFKSNALYERVEKLQEDVARLREAMKTKAGSNLASRNYSKTLSLKRHFHPTHCDSSQELYMSSAAAEEKKMARYYLVRNYMAQLSCLDMECKMELTYLGWKKENIDHLTGLALSWGPMMCQ